MILKHIGTDPEFFLEFNNTIVASQGVLPGTKDEPFLTSNGAVHRDNVLGELGIKPAKTAEELIQNINAVIEDVQLMIPHHKLVFKAHHYMDHKFLNNAEAREFGCEPDFNAWTNTENPRPYATDPTLRSAGGHIHLDFDYKNDEDRLKVAKVCDLVLGLPSLLIDKEGLLRKELYGRAGQMRFKPYGIEYRMLSNFWLNSPELITWVYNQSKRAVEEVDKLYEEMIITGLEHFLEGCINNNDVELAERIIPHFNIELPRAA